MAIHSNGNGDAWTELAPDVNQPHGLDYREFQDLRKGVRKRIAKQHLTFADNTVGGEHLPGGSSILYTLDSTQVAAVDSKAGDATGQHAKGLACLTGFDGSSVSLWFYDDNTSATPIMITPASICRGADFTWTGAHEFDGTIDFSSCWFDDSVDIQGRLTCASNVTITGDLSVGGAALFASDVSVAGGLNVAGDLTVTGTTRVTGDVSIQGKLTVKTTDFSKQTITVWANCGSASSDIHSSLGLSTFNRIAEGDYSFAWSSAFSDATSYAVICFQGQGGTMTLNYYSQLSGSIGIKSWNGADAPKDISSFCILAIGT